MSVSNKKKLVHMSLEKPLFSYHSFEEIINFVNDFWQKRKSFFPGYYFIHPTLNQSQKWTYDYIFIVKNKP